MMCIGAVFLGKRVMSLDVKAKPPSRNFQNMLSQGDFFEFYGLINIKHQFQDFFKKIS